MQFVDENAGRLHAGENVGRKRLDLKGRAVALMRDLFEMRLNMQQAAQRLVGRDHALDLAEGELGDLLGWGDEEELGVGPLVDQQRRALLRE
ncbi:MAG: hypothetical protein WDN46_14910 [Methylocella sp.]